jgi:hypothetical protein
MLFHSRIVGRVCITAALLAVGQFSTAAPGNEPRSTTLAVDYLLRSQAPSGFLLYGFDFLQDSALEPGAMSAVQLTRQAGAAAVLADYYSVTRDPRAALAVTRLLGALEAHTLPISQNRLQGLVAWAGLLRVPVGRYRMASALNRYGLLFEPEGPGKLLSPDSNYANAYAGAAALALLAELRYVQASGDDRFASLRRALLEGLLALRIPGDGFRMDPTSIDTNAYFDAEAWTALAAYRRAFPDEARVEEILREVDAALMRKYGAEFRLPFFHWGTMAAALRYPDRREREFLEFIRAQTTEFLNQVERHPDNDNNCAAVEGVIDAIGTLRDAGEPGGALTLRAMRWARAEMSKAWRMQIEPGQTELVFANARIIAPRMQEFAGSFRSGLYGADTLVDYTGHCLSAMVKSKRQHIDLGVDSP